MAAIFYQYSTDNTTIFKGGINVTENVTIGFLADLIGRRGMMIINEVAWQNRDTIQYFLTFDDLISYFYFGKGLGQVTITGSIFHDCENGNNWSGLDGLTRKLGEIRGTKLDNVRFGSVAFEAVMSSFTLRASADPQSIHSVDFVVQLDIISSTLPAAEFTPKC